MPSDSLVPIAPSNVDTHRSLTDFRSPGTVRPMSPMLPAEELRARLSGLEKELPELRLLVMFGSAATGCVRDDSDLDLAVVCDDAADLDRLFMILAPR